MRQGALFQRGEPIVRTASCGFMMKLRQTPSATASFIQVAELVTALR
jgi:hypothetical protein